MVCLKRNEEKHACVSSQCYCTCCTYSKYILRNTKKSITSSGPLQQKIIMWTVTVPVTIYNCIVLPAVCHWFSMNAPKHQSKRWVEQSRYISANRWPIWFSSSGPDFYFNHDSTFSSSCFTGHSWGNPFKAAGATRKEICGSYRMIYTKFPSHIRILLGDR